MGDGADMSDLDRFLRSGEGQTYLETIRAGLVGRRIYNVNFGNDVHRVMTTLHLDDGTVFEAYQPEHEVEALRVSFEDVLDREYEADYPERGSVS
jgi:hypothetical protein